MPGGLKTFLLLQGSIFCIFPMEFLLLSLEIQSMLVNFTLEESGNVPPKRSKDIYFQNQHLHFAFCCSSLAVEEESTGDDQNLMKKILLPIKISWTICSSACWMAQVPFFKWRWQHNNAHLTLIFCLTCCCLRLTGFFYSLSRA